MKAQLFASAALRLLSSIPGTLSLRSIILNKQSPPPLLNLKTLKRTHPHSLFVEPPPLHQKMPPIKIKKSMNEVIIVVILKGVMQLILV
eukprot:scaffold3121_cov211-Skeletonema_marinoi.AAC.14